MKFRLLCTVLIIVLFQISVMGQSVQGLLNQAEVIKDKDYQQGLELYQKVLIQEPDNFEAVWNAAFLYTRIGAASTNADIKKDYLMHGMELAEKAYDLRPDNVNANYIMAAAIGRLVDTMSAKERVKSASDIREYALSALEIDSTHAPTWHVMGRLDYRLSNLNVAERAAAAILFGGLPKNVSMGNAIDYYQKAVDNRPDYILYQLDLAKALIQDKQRDRAKKVLQDLIRVEPYTEDDPEYLEDARQLLERL